MIVVTTELDLAKGAYFGFSAGVTLKVYNLTH